MMPVIRIPDAVYERLQKHATPFTDTPATVIERLLDAYEANERRSAGVRFDQERRPESLGATEASPVTAEGKQIPNAWIKIVHYLFEQKAFDETTAVSKKQCMEQGGCGKWGYGELEEAPHQLVQSYKPEGQRAYLFYLTPEGRQLAAGGKPA